MTATQERSGQLRIRMPHTLHQHLSELAETEGVSLNHLIVALLAGGSNYKLGDTK
jgi:predicted HicB family RNase H-like nuclease